MKYLSLVFIAAFTLLISCKPDSKTSESLEGMEDSDGVDLTEIDEEEEYSDLLENAMEAMDTSDTASALVNLKQAEKYFIDIIAEDKTNKEAESVSLALGQIIKNVNDKKIATGEQLEAALKGIAYFSELFEVEVEDVDSESGN